LRTNL